MLSNAEANAQEVGVELVHRAILRLQPRLGWMHARTRAECGPPGGTSMCRGNSASRWGSSCALT
jgi:hypothetical protein